LECDVSAVPDNLGSNLDQFHEKAAKRPVLDFLGKYQPSKKVTQIIGQNKQPEPHLIGDESFA
jgi:hypothetical protein